MHSHHPTDECRSQAGSTPRFAHHPFQHPFVAGHPHGHGGRIGPRARRGDIRTAVLRLLAEEPMHGYQIIQELSTRSGGAWSPSAGSVYPTLQLLADEDLISAEESSGKKVFNLTPAGTEAVAEMKDQPAPWESVAQNTQSSAELREAATKLMPVLAQFGRGGTREQLAAATEILNDARKQLYTILAED
ncbi:MAG: PadR family transcriptional regulator [Coriobacteriia bacterium]|nr:PadR family transcriptional regulator [Coriobacteriia bacterium]